MKGVAPYISLAQIGREEVFQKIKDKTFDKKGTPIEFCFYPDTGVIVVWPKPDKPIKAIRVIIDL